MSNIHVIIKNLKIARMFLMWNTKYIPTSLTKKNKHRTMIEEDKIALTRQSFDGLFYYNDQSYTYHPLEKILSGGYVYVSSLLIKMTANYHLFVINMSILLCDGTTTSTWPWSLTQWISHLKNPLNESLSG